MQSRHTTPRVHASFTPCVHTRQVGELEQDLVLGEKTSKDLIAFLTGAVVYEIALC
jgi:hypothetical protein